MYTRFYIHMRFSLLLLFLMMLTAFGLYAQESPPTPDDIPEPMPTLDEGEYDIVNFLLLGSDTTNPNNAGRTDVILIVSVNRTVGTVSMLSLPRDLYVYIPGYRVYRINSAFGYGENEVGDGEGYNLLIETIRYNLGLEIDYYARVDFRGFRAIVDDLGGVDISVDCAIEDWRLIEPDIDPTLEESYEIFTLPVGVQSMDGDLALWYARSRRTSSDFDRGRRHQALMRALWSRVRGLDLLTQLPDIWTQVTETVETNIGLDTMIELATLAGTIDTSHIASYTFRPNIEVTSWQSPEGSSVLAPVRDAISALETQFYQPPTENRLVQENARIEIINASGIPGLDVVAADRLAWEGFTPVIGAPADRYQEYSTLVDYTGQTKGSSLGMLQQIVRVSDESLVIEPQANREFDFRVTIGGSYHTCTHGVLQPSSAYGADT